MIKYRDALLPLVLCLALGVAYVLAGNYLLKRIFALNDQMSQAKSEQANLQRKLAILEDTQASVDSFREKVVQALPDTNPSLIALAQIKTFVSEESVILSNLSSSSESQNGDIYKTTLTFDLDAPTESAFTVLKKLSAAAPLGSIDKLTTVDSGSGTRFSVGLSYYWSPFPLTIPSASSASSEFSDKENQTLQFVSTLNFPEVLNTEQIVRGSSQERQDPFNEVQ